MKKKIISITHTCSLLLLTLCGCGKPNKNNENLLIVGTNSGFPPYEMIDSHGNLIGFDIEIAKHIAAKLGKQLEIKDMSFDALMIALQQGTIDCAIAGISITKSREQEIALIHYTGSPLTELPLVFWEKIPAGITTVEDIALAENKTICVQSGTLQAEIIANYSRIEIKHLENIPDLIMDIKYGKSIAAILEPKVAEVLKTKHPEIHILRIPLTTQQQDGGAGIGINKNNHAMINAVQAIINELKNNGGIQQYEQQWFNGDNHGTE